MTKIFENPNGTFGVASFSNFAGNEDSQSEFKKTVDGVAVHNLKASAEWSCLTSEARAARINEFIDAENNMLGFLVKKTDEERKVIFDQYWAEYGSI